jgi:prepilin-type N-terminal cleavage/methylation domain-containing protein
MKTPSFRRRRGGFTLVELLVVIAIIAVLAGAGFAAGNAAIQKAKRTTALATAVSLEKAVIDFHNEYGYMPVEADTDTTVNTKNNVAVVEVLLGMASANTGSSGNTLNTRGIKFLDVREGKGSKNGLVYRGSNGATKVQGLYDPWGGGYYVLLDGDYDEELTIPSSAGGGTLNGRKVAVWSLGADGTAGSGKVKDNVYSWK